jgi:iron complex transport system substrate-binding protein
MFRRTAVLLLLLMGIPSTALLRAQDPVTLEAPAALRDLVTVVWQAYSDEAPPAFVDAGGDVLASNDRATLETAAQVAYLLPDTGLIAQADRPEVAAFLDWAASTDAQAALIAADYLPATVTIIDQAGNEIALDQPLQSAITPYSLATYLVYGVGAADRLVAASYLGAPGETGAARMTAFDPRFPELSGFGMSQREINIEAVAGLAPELILTSTRTQWLDTAAELGIPFILFEGETIAALQESVRLTGLAFGAGSTALAERWIAEYDAIVAEIAAAVASASGEPPRVLFVGSEPQRVASGEMYQSAMIQAAGGVSVSGDLPGYWNDVNLEQVLLWDPEIIFVATYSPESYTTITTSPEWAAVPAVAAGRVYAMPSYVAPWDTPIQESILGIQWLASIMQPEVFTFDCAARTADFYATYYQFELPEAELAAVCDQP